MGRYIIEFGMGADFHGQDVSNAARKAVKDAVSKSCLCGLDEVLHLKDLNEDVIITVTVATSRPDEVDIQSIAECLPIGTVQVKSVSGGLHVSGLYLPVFGDKDDSVEVAVASVEVAIADN